MESKPGNMDMYASFGGINQTYSPPIPLDDINTVYGETTPVLSQMVKHYILHLIGPMVLEERYLVCTERK